jgi:2-dehydro-3-deoxyglucarate aldolase
MNKLKSLKSIRKKLIRNQRSFGTWMQIPNASIAEIIGQMGFEWVAIDMEHGSISLSQLPDIFRALELGNTLPLVRLAQGEIKDCKQALDAGASGVIIPMVNNAKNLKKTLDFCRWPPLGNRGVAFSRANVFGKNFDKYKYEAQRPLVIAMIEDFVAVDNLEEILQVNGLDAILIGPYDLSASLGILGEFSDIKFKKITNKILKLASKYNVPAGMHIVEPSKISVKKTIKQGYTFIACGMDSQMIRASASDYISFIKKKDLNKKI